MKNRYVIAISLLLSVSLCEVQARTVKDVLRRIEKKPRTLPKYQEQKARKKGRVTVRIAKPTNSFSAYFPEGSVERAYENSLNKEINQLYLLTKKLKSPATKKKIILKLARAYSEKAALLDRREQDKYDADLKKYLAGSIKRKPRLNNSQSHKFNRKAVDLYKAYVRNFPRERDLDQVLFFLGYNSMSLDRTEEAIKYYTKLSKDYPRSEFVDEANLSLGDYYFEKDQKSRARKYYQKIVKSRRSHLKNLATYKLAWVQYKTGEYNPALKNIFKVIRNGKDVGLRDKRSAALAKEAQRDLPMFYAEAGNPRSAVSYFTNLMSRKEASKSLEQLAYYYADKGDRDEARFLFNKLIELSPEKDKSFDYQYSLVNMQSSTGRKDLYERELFLWVRKFGPQSSWAKNNKNTKRVKEAVAKAESALRAHVLKLHNQSRKTTRKADMAHAEKGYDVYLKNFPNSENTEEMRFYYGELLYEMGLYKEAYLAYSRVKKAPYSKKAILNSVLSLEKVIPKDEEIRAKVGTSTEEYPLVASEKSFIRSAKKYLADPSNKEQRLEIKYKLASIYYSHNYFDKSEPLFKEIIKEDPKSKLAKYSSDLIIDSYKLRKDYAGLEKAGGELVGLSKGSGANLVAVDEVKGIVQQSAFKKIEEIAVNQGPEAGAKAFIDYTKKYPNSKYLNQAFYNAAVNYEKAGKFQDSLSAYSRVKNGKDSLELYNKSQRYSALLYEKLGSLQKAAELYERLAGQKAESAQTKKKYLSNAAVIREAFNQASDLKRIFKKLASYDSKKEVALYDYRLAKLYKRTNKMPESMAYSKKFVDKAKSDPFLLVKTAAELADTYKKRKNRYSADLWYNKTLKLYRKYRKSGASKASAYAAEAEFNLSDKLFYDFLAVKIPENPAKQQKAITKKLALVDTINKKMTDVINYDDGYTIVSALNRLGQVYQHLTFSILTAPLPKGLSAEDLKKVKSLLIEKVKPFKESALNSYKKAVAKGDELKTFAGPYLTTLKELSSLDAEFSPYKLRYEVLKDFELMDAEDKRDFSLPEISTSRSESYYIEQAASLLSNPEQKDRGWLTLALYYSRKGLPLVSGLFLAKSSESFKDSGVYHNIKAYNYLEQKERRLAIAGFQKAIDKKPSSPSALYNLATLYMEYGGFEAGGRLLTRIYPEKLDALSSPARVSAVNDFALFSMAKGSVDESISELKSVFNKNKQNRVLAKNLALISVLAAKDKKLKERYLSQYKKLAKTRDDFDTINILESTQL